MNYDQWKTMTPEEYFGEPELKDVDVAVTFGIPTEDVNDAVILLNNLFTNVDVECIPIDGGENTNLMAWFTVTDVEEELAKDTVEDLLKDSILNQTIEDFEVE
jgi:hypothetical protein